MRSKSSNIYTDDLNAPFQFLMSEKTICNIKKHTNRQAQISEIRK